MRAMSVTLQSYGRGENIRQRVPLTIEERTLSRLCVEYVGPAQPTPRVGRGEGANHYFLLYVWSTYSLVSEIETGAFV